MAGSDVASPDRRGFGRNLCWLLLAVVGAAGLAACVPAPPPPPPSTDCTTTWKGAAGADFGAAANWSKNAVPGATDIACSVAGSSIVVTGTHHVRALRALGSVEVHADAQLTLDTASEVDVLVHDGLLTGPATVEVGRLDWSAGGFDSGLVVRVGDGVGDPSVVDGAVDLCGEATVAVLGELDVAAGAAVTTTACAPGADPLVQVADGATLRATGTGELGVPVQLDGALTVDDGATLDLATAPTMVSSSSMHLGGAGATLRVVAGTGNLVLGEGRLTGVGTLDGSVSGPGSVSPTPDAVLHVTGSVAADATVVLELPFSSPAPQKPGRLTVDGAADLSSTTVMASFGAESNLATKTFTVASGAPLTSTGTQLSLPEGLGIGGRLVQVGDELRLDLNHCDPATFHPMVTVPQSLTGKDLSGCDLRGAIFTTATAGSADFTGSRLDGISASGASFSGANFTDASLRGAIGFTASLATWDNTVCPDGTNSDANGSTCVGHFGSSVLQVNTTADTVDIAPGDGVCATGAMVGATPACSLRAAVMESNALPGFDVVWLAPTPLVLTGSSIDDADAATGDLDVTDGLFIRRQTYVNGDSAVTISGSGPERIFDVAPGAELMLDAVTLQGGAVDQARNAGSLFLGRATQLPVTVHAGAVIGVTNTGRLTLQSAVVDGADAATALDSVGFLEVDTSSVSRPMTSTGVARIDGGTFGSADARAAVTSQGSLRISSAAVADAALGIEADGETIVDSLTATGVDTVVRSNGTLTVASSTLTSGGAGTAIDVIGGKATITASTVSGHGTGVAVTGGTAIVTETMIEANAVGVAASGPLAVETSHLRANGVGASLAGGSSLRRTTVSGSTGDAVVATGEVTLDRVTISGNAGTGLTSAGGSTVIVDSTIADNGSGIDAGTDPVGLAGTIVATQTGGAPDCTAPVTSDGWNLDSDGTCGLASPGDLSGADPQLRPLLAGLGFGPTHAPRPGSPVIDAGRPDCATSDQAGVPRPVDGDGDGTPRCEIGAVEVGGIDGLDLAVNSTRDVHDAHPGDGVCETDVVGQCTLPAALDESALSLGADTIQIAPGSYKKGRVGSGGVAIDGSAVVASVEVQADGPVQLTGLTLGELTNAAGEVTLTDVDMTTSGRKGISNHGVLHAQRLRLRPYAIGLVNAAGATADLERVLIYDGDQGGIVNDGTVRLVDTTVAYNEGGGLLGTGAYELTSSVIDRQAPGAPACTAAVQSHGYNAADSSCGLTDPSDVVASTGFVVPYDLPSPVTGAFVPISGTAIVDSGRPDCSTDVAGSAALDGDGDGVNACDRGALEVAVPVSLTFVVNDTGNAVDARLGDGMCETGIAGQCTLRAAIQEANRMPGRDHIELQSGAVYRVPSGNLDDTGVAGDLDIWGAVMIEGNGATVGENSAASAADLFHIVAGEGAEFRNLTIINMYGGIENWGELTLEDLAASRASPVVDSSGVLTIDGFSTGATIGPGGGTAIRSTGDAVVRDASISLYSTALSTAGSAQVENLATTGGLSNSGSLQARRVVMNGSAAKVTTTGAGATTSITMSSVSTTSFGTVTATGGTTEITSSTLSSASGKTVDASGGIVSITNTIVAGKAPVCSAPVASGGWNAASDTSCGLSQPTDASMDGLGLLQPAPQTGFGTVYFPLAVPEVLDGGYPGCEAVDLWGRPRTDGDGNGSTLCDRGALELDAYRSLTMTVNSTVDAVDATPGDGVCQTATVGQCTLRAAITEANLGTGPDTITLQALQTYRLDGVSASEGELVSGDLDVWTPLTLRASLSSVSGGDIEIHGGSVIVRDLTANGASIRQRGGSVSLERLKWLMGATVEVSGQASITDGVATSGQLVVNATASATVARTSFSDVGSGSVISSAGSLSLVQVAASSSKQVLSVGGTRPTSLDRVTLDAGTEAVSQTSTAPITIVDSTLRGSLSRSIGGSITAINTVMGRAPGATWTCSRQITSGGWNLTDGAGCGLTQPTDLVVDDVELGLFTKNGGTLPSILPLPSSLAVDTGRPGCTATDQRGKSRPVDGDADGIATCDRGSNELGVVQPLAMVVTSGSTGVDANPGDGQCRTSTSTCTLTAAVMEANTSNGADTITLSVPNWVSVNRLDIASELLIDGGGEVVNAQGDGIHIWASQPVTVRDVNFYALSDVEGLTVHAAPVVLDHVEAKLSMVVNAGGDVTVQGGSDIGELRDGPADGYAADVPGPWQPTTEVLDSVIGHLNVQGVVSVRRSRLHSALVENVLAHLVMEASTLYGDGRFLAHSQPFEVRRGSAEIVDSTITWYQVIEAGSIEPMTLWNSGAPFGATVTISNSIVTGCTGPVVSGGYNLGCGSDPTDVLVATVAEYGLGVIGDHGGPTQTFLPDATSPAVDSGAPTCGPVDQRGLPRPVGAACDRGAVERQ